MEKAESQAPSGAILRQGVRARVGFEQSGSLSITAALGIFLNGHFFLNFAHFANREMHLVQGRGGLTGWHEREGPESNAGLSQTVSIHHLH